MERTRNRPPKHDEQKSAARSQDVEHSAAYCIQQGVGNQERKLQPRKLLITERYRLLDCGYSNRQRLSIEIANGDRRRNHRDEVPLYLDSLMFLNIAYQYRHIVTISDASVR